MSAVPIRVRLTLAFAVAMAMVLTATGVFLYVRLGSGLDRTIDQGLRARAADVAALAQQADTGLHDTTHALRPDTSFAQVLSTGGTIVDSTPGLAARPLLSLTRLQQAQRHASFFASTIGDERIRLYATPVRAQGVPRVVVVGASLEARASALGDLRTQLLVGGPIALLLSSIAAYLLAAAALRPVERMSERAATISGTSAGRRLPVPRANDEISRLGERLNEMLARLEAALERERALVSNASHELRTPLALLKTEIELALAAPESAETLAAALRSVGEETDRLAQLADDLLLLARVDGGALALRRSPVQIEEVLETIATRFARRAEEVGRTIEVDAAPSLDELVDRRRLEQALSNLVENSLRYGRGPIRLSATEFGAQLVISVRDSGPGFPDVFVARAFERFTRADQSRAGAGLGLAIVEAIALAHGGTARAANLAEGGAEVTLTLPVRRPAHEPVAL